MHAIEITGGFGLDSLQVVERPEPAPGPGQVLVRVRACSLNFRDLMVVTGVYNPKLRLPLVPLSDGAGVVEAVGAGVTRVKTGQRVAGIFMQQWLYGPLSDAKARSDLGGHLPGMLAEYVVLDQEGVVPVPAHLSDEEAATLPCAAVTSWHALVHEGQTRPGDTILIQGTGGVSLFALQFAHLLGARVIILSKSDDKLARARGMGAAESINYKANPEWDKRVREFTDNAGVDHVVEVGGANTLGRSLRCVRLGGRISVIGVLSGAGGEINPVTVLMKMIRLQGIFVGSREMFEAMNRAIAQHQLRPVVDRVFDFRELGPALKYLQAGAHFGKVCLKFDGA